MSSAPINKQAESYALIFSAQALNMTEEVMAQLYGALQRDATLQWVQEVIETLTRQWQAVEEAIPDLKRFPTAKKSLRSLETWLQTGTVGDGLTFPLPNTILMPLVVLTQLSQYSVFVAQKEPRTSQLETLGLCTGLLSAAAVSNAANPAQIGRYSAVSLRIAILIGALVDSNDTIARNGDTETPETHWRCFSVLWKSPEAKNALHEVLEGFSEAYISVATDDRRVTVTCRTTDCNALQQRLQSRGLVTSTINLQGSFHNRNNITMTDSLVSFCNSHEAFQFPDASELVVPMRLDSGGGKLIESGRLHEVIIRSILTQLSSWPEAFAELHTTSRTSQTLISFGLETCIPSWLSRKLGPRRALQLTSVDLDRLVEQLQHVPQHAASNRRGLQNGDDLTSALPSPPPQTVLHTRDGDAVAVIGMSCNLPGASDLDEFWDILCAGQSQHMEVPAERFSFQTAWRKDTVPNRKWFGNFIRDHDTFDHKFFKKSPREMASTDPQHRLMLQTAYQAVEQSGYFNRSDGDAVDRHVGCYIGVGLVDYENNIACHAPGAYTATGNLKAFAAGKISHHFGWTGPGLTVDTACSSSAVAVHQACRAILSGECTSALAGGVNVMTSPEWFQNLAGASFLSPTGQCKPFDAAADGYCRAEGVGAVFLTSLSNAVRNGNQVLGVIASSAVYQNENCTAITVPNAPSLSTLFQDVLDRAGLEKDHISVVEAHGTGTPVGDPAEYDSVRRVFGPSSKPSSTASGTNRPKLSLGSVKGLLGHTESASGIVALIKTLLMISNGGIPPQASFKTINPAIGAQPHDNIDIPVALQSWDTDFRAALINNYGASGSNASLVVTQNPLVSRVQVADLPAPVPAAPGSVERKYPFWLCGIDERSVGAYAGKLLRFVKSRTAPDSRPLLLNSPPLTLADVSFQLASQSNRRLDKAMIFACSSLHELEEKLRSLNGGVAAIPTAPRHETARPVILCFGGQVSRFVGLDRDAFESLAILRSYLHQVDEVCASLGLESIYKAPDIFQKTPVDDTVKLQLMLFALQYACAQCWMASGVQPAATVGHSFGELTAMCVSGVLSLRDTLKVVAGRARAIRDGWGQDAGAMLAVEADKEELDRLIEKSRIRSQSGSGPDCSAGAGIVCFNGPRSFTVGGSTEGIQALVETAAESGHAFSSLKLKALDVTNAFHSPLVDDIVPQLEALGTQVHLREPSIVLERAVAHTDTSLDSRFVATHMRDPVFFHQAVHRLSQKHPDCIWLECGSNSTITSMAKRALDSPKSSHHFQAINLTSGRGAVSALTDATLSLWRAGLPLSFWAHHAMQAPEHPLVLLPPYQFEKVKHWMELKPLPQASETPAHCDCATTTGPRHETTPETLWTFLGYQDDQRQKARFRINTTSKEYLTLVGAHIVAQSSAICPSTFQLAIAIDALASLTGDPKSVTLQPESDGLANHAPMTLEDSRTDPYWLEADRSSGGLDDAGAPTAWHWKIIRGQGHKTNRKQGAPTLYASGCISFRRKDDVQCQAAFDRYERLVGSGRRRCLELLEGNAADGIIQGSGNVYKLFDRFVEYNHESYRGLQKICGSHFVESAGLVDVGSSTQDMWLDLGLADAFCQVAGIFLNCMTDLPDGEMYISDKIEKWLRSPKAATNQVDKNIHGKTPALANGRRAYACEWEVLACHSRISEQEVVSDVYVFDKQDGSLHEIIMGIHYTRVPRAALAKRLARLSSSSAQPAGPTGTTTKDIPGTTDVKDAMFNKAETKHEATVNGFGNSPSTTTQPSPTQSASPRERTPRRDIIAPLRGIISSLSGLEPEEIKDGAELADLGIDSLMGMELASEIQTTFEVVLDMDELAGLTDLSGLVRCLVKALGIVGGFEVNGEDGNAHVETLPQLPSKEGPLHGMNGLTNGGTNTPDTPSTASAQATPELDEIIPSSIMVEAFEETKARTDDFIEANGLADYSKNILPLSKELCLVHILDAFDQLGCSVRDARPNHPIPAVTHLARHEQFVELIYNLLQSAGLVKLEPNHKTRIVRTDVPCPEGSAADRTEQLIALNQDHAFDHRLTSLTGGRLAECLTGKVDGLQLIFASALGREIVSGMYGKSPINVAWIRQMEHLLQAFLSRLSDSHQPARRTPIRILEIGAGTGGTTATLLPLLARSGLPVKYVITDISSSLVVAARKRFKAQYPFVDFHALDIESETPPPELLASQDLIIATNCIHATHNLATSLSNIRRLLRPGGFLAMLEMTEQVPWIDLVFGLVEGWWLFNDGRRHALAPPEVWQQTLRDSGYGHIDWTQGHRPEASIQRIIIAAATNEVPGHREYVLDSLSPVSGGHHADNALRRDIINEFVTQYIHGFKLPTTQKVNGPEQGNGNLAGPYLNQYARGGSCVLVTGATGSLGSHVVVHLASLSEVDRVICLNRPRYRQSANGVPEFDPAHVRQLQAFSSRHLTLSPVSVAKLWVLEADTSKPRLGLSQATYDEVTAQVTHIVHNAWPMSITRGVEHFEAQFRAFRNLLDLAASCVVRLGCIDEHAQNYHGDVPGNLTSPAGQRRLGFIFVSSIATVGNHPEYNNGQPLVPEEPVTDVSSTLANGYGDAKLVCEKMLENTLCQSPSVFRATSVRIGQIAGNTSSGHWNPVEHLAFLIKSSQTVGALPAFQGDLSWCPVDTVAATLGDLLLGDNLQRPFHPIHHIENPKRQAWGDMVRTLAVALNISSANIVPFPDWLTRVRLHAGPASDNPAAGLVDFLQEHFIRMSCGGLVLDTSRTVERSKTLKATGPVSEETVMKYIYTWKATGFLK